MRALFQRLPFHSWPISLKLLIGFTLAVLVPTLFAGLIIRDEVSAADLENLTAYLREQGAERQDRIIEDLSLIDQTLTNFVDNLAYRDAILQVLTSGGPTDPEANPAPQVLLDYMNDVLISGGMFSRVLILNADGMVIVSSNPISTEVIIPEPGTDWSQSSGYQAGITARNLNETKRREVIVENDIVTIEIAHVFNFQGRDLGYVIGTIDHTHVVSNVLVNEDAFRPVESFLTTLDGQIIAPENTIETRRLTQVLPLVRRALGGEAGIETYTYENEDYLAYFAPIPETSLALISDIPADQTFTITLGRAGGRITLYIGGILLLSLLIAISTDQFITPALRRLERSVRAMSEGDFEAPISETKRGDEIGALARTFESLREQTQSVLEELHKRVDARVRDLQATQEVSRYAATERDLQALMDNVVGLIIKLFPNIYHAQIFLIDDENQFAILRASTGEAGRQLLARGHRLAVGSISVIGQVTDEGRVVVARDTAASNVHRQNEFLRETRAELAIPLRVGDRIIGAMDVQSKESGSFTEDQVRILQTMADQIAIAIENARLYQESIQRLEEITLSNQRATQSAWKDYMNAQRVTVLSSEAGIYTETEFDLLRQSAIERGEPIMGEKTDRDTIPVAVPIVLRGQTLGAIEWELRAADFNYDKVLLGQELVNRLAISLDNARLFQESRRATSRERLVNEISARLTTQTDIDSILQTAVREVGQALRAPQVSVQLKRQTEQENSSNGHHGEEK